VTAHRRGAYATFRSGAFDKPFRASRPLGAIIGRGDIAKRRGQHRAAWRAGQRVAPGIRHKLQPSVASESGDPTMPKHGQGVATDEILGGASNSRAVGVTGSDDLELS
jgi:hypothetical protein